MSIIPNPQPPEIIEALRAAGCGILRRPSPETPPDMPADRVVPVEKIPRAVRTNNLKTIRSVVAAVCGISVNEMISERRHYPVCRARQIFYFAARELTPASLPAIGKACNGKDHSTVLHGIKKVEADREAFEPELSRVLTWMTRRG